MILPPLLALFAWIPVGLYFFWRYPVRVAILINFLAGWALLPSANYAFTSAAFPYWILATSLPANYFITKASVVGFTSLLGVLLFDGERIVGFRFGFLDLPILLWCLAPLLSAIANPVDFVSGLRGMVYQALAWGAPYLCGRLYFSGKDSLQLAAKAFVIAGVAYVPICLVEMFAGPQIYAHLYGYQPYRWVGAQRYIGFRPIGLLEDGNQLGIWMATSALIATALSKYRLVEKVLGVPIAWLGGGLVLMTLLCQSGGSILLLFGLLALIWFGRRSLLRAATVVCLLGILLFATLRLANVISLRSIVEHNRTAGAAAGLLKKADRGSFGWRLSQDERDVSVALQKPLLGYGEWDWWKNGTLRPWGLWLLAFGMYGIFGLLALESLLLFPVARTVASRAAPAQAGFEDLRYLLAAAILMSAADSLLNSAVILPVVLLVGGLTMGSRLALEAPSAQQRRSPVLASSSRGREDRFAMFRPRAGAPERRP